jgi:dienelactone hydrolase
MSSWKRSDAGEAAIALLSPTSMLEAGSMRYMTSLATAALTLASPFILAHCASVLEPLTYDANSVGKPNSGAPMELWLPPGTGPFPAVVVMHGCAGITTHHRGWAGRLTEWGYAAALLDSFHPRNANSTCWNAMSNPRPALMAQDAFNAATYLRTLPIIQPDHIGTTGFSRGGSAALFTALASGAPADRGGRPFQAVVAYYPGCLLKKPGELEKILGEPASDVLILIGKNDEWTPAADCLKYVELQSGFPHAPTIKVYPGAVHVFDIHFQVYVDQEGHSVGANPEARADSHVMAKPFLDARLKSK